MRTGNPALSDKVFNSSRTVAPTDVMTLEGTVNKTIISILLTTIAAYWSWSHPAEMGGLTFLFLIAGFILALVIIFKKTLAPLLTPVYAIVEGFALGTISLMYATATAENPAMVVQGTMPPNTTIVFQAVSLTFGTLFCLLMAYRSGLIKATENFKLGIVAATGAIALIYILTMVLGLFGVHMTFLHDSGMFSIGFSLVVVVVAALNLVLDFDFIENAAESKSVPKYMEWYGAFGLLVTLIWLYLEILRLLAKLQSRD